MNEAEDVYHQIAEAMNQAIIKLYRYLNEASKTVPRNTDTAKMPVWEGKEIVAKSYGETSRH